MNNANEFSEAIRWPESASRDRAALKIIPDDYQLIIAGEFSIYGTGELRMTGNGELAVI